MFSIYIQEVTKLGLIPLVTLQPSLNLFEGAKDIAVTVTRKVAPSGFVHLCFAFGPLMIESGIPEYVLVIIIRVV